MSTLHLYDIVGERKLQEILVFFQDFKKFDHGYIMQNSWEIFNNIIQLTHLIDNNDSRGLEVLSDFVQHPLMRYVIKNKLVIPTYLLNKISQAQEVDYRIINILSLTLEDYLFVTLGDDCQIYDLLNKCINFVLSAKKLDAMDSLKLLEVLCRHNCFIKLISAWSVHKMQQFGKLVLNYLEDNDKTLTLNALVLYINIVIRCGLDITKDFLSDSNIKQTLKIFTTTIFKCQKKLQEFNLIVLSLRGLKDIVVVREFVNYLEKHDEYFHLIDMTLDILLNFAPTLNAEYKSKIIYLIFDLWRLLISPEKHVHCRMYEKEMKEKNNKYLIQKLIADSNLNLKISNTQCNPCPQAIVSCATIKDDELTIENFLSTPEINTVTNTNYKNDFLEFLFNHVLKFNTIQPIFRDFNNQDYINPYFEFLFFTESLLPTLSWNTSEKYEHNFDTMGYNNCRLTFSYVPITNNLTKFHLNILDYADNEGKNIGNINNLFNYLNLLFSTYIPKYLQSVDLEIDHLLLFMSENKSSAYMEEIFTIIMNRLKYVLLELALRTCLRLLTDNSAINGLASSHDKQLMSNLKQLLTNSKLYSTIASIGSKLLNLSFMIYLNVRKTITPTRDLLFEKINHTAMLVIYVKEWLQAYLGKSKSDAIANALLAEGGEHEFTSATDGITLSFFTTKINDDIPPYDINEWLCCFLDTLTKPSTLQFDREISQTVVKFFLTSIIQLDKSLNYLKTVSSKGQPNDEDKFEILIQRITTYIGFQLNLANDSKPCTFPKIPSLILDATPRLKDVSSSDDLAQTISSHEWLNRRELLFEEVQKLFKALENERGYEEQTNICEIIDLHASTMKIMKQDEKLHFEALSQQNHVIASYQNIINRLRLSQTNHELELQKYQQIIARLSDSLDASTLTQNELREEITALSQIIGEKEILVKKLTIALDECKDVLDNELKKKNDMEKNIEMYKSDYETLNEMHQVLVKHYEGAKQQHENLRQQISAYERENSLLKRDVKEKDNNIADSLSTISTMKNNAEVNEKEIKKLHLIIEQLRKDTDVIHAERKSLQQEKSSLEAFCKKQTNLLGEKEQSLKSLQTELQLYTDITSKISHLTMGITKKL